MIPDRIDVAILGGGPTGLAAAIQLSRMTRAVVVFDEGRQRNRTAAAMHSFPAHDGQPPLEFLADARAEAERFGATVAPIGVERVVPDGLGAFTVTASDGSSLTARRVLLATGITDVLPDIDGVRKHWGRSVIHCPYCHGHEVRGQRITVLDTNGVGAHQALLFSQLSNAVTLVVVNGEGPSPDERDRLDLAGVTVMQSEVERVDGDDRVRAVVLSDGTEVASDAVVVGPRWELNIAAVAELDLETAENPFGLGRTLVVNAVGETSHRGIWAAGNVVDPSLQVLPSAAAGSVTAAQLNFDLLNDDLAKRAASLTELEHWESRYLESPQWWSGNPNGSLVVEAGELAPGRALDVGCGEGADVIWLAQRGWDVTGVDISPTAIERARQAAEAAGVKATLFDADVLVDPPAEASFDLVSIQYPALIKVAGAAAMRRLARCVAPGGILLIVGHDMRPFADDEHFRRRHAHYAGAEELMSVLGDEFTIEVNEIRPRPNAPEGARHVDDVVIRARRSA